MKVWVGYKKLKSGNWRIRFRSKVKGETGITLPGSLKEKTIEKKVAWYQEEIRLGSFDPYKQNDVSHSVDKAVSAYIRAHEKKTWSDKQLFNVETRLTLMINHIGGRAKLVNVRDWDWVTDQDLSPASKKSYLSTTKAFLNWCVKREYIEEFELEIPLQLKKELLNKEIKYITWEELDAVCQAHTLRRAAVDKFDTQGFTPERHIHLWWFMFWQALRKEEAPKIKFSDIQRDKIKVYGKGNKTEKIPIVPPAQKHIDGFKQNQISEYLIGFKSMDSPKRQLKLAIQKALPFHHSFGFHQLRHGGAVHYLTSGVPLIFVSKLLRHANTSVTSREYADIIDGMEGSAFTMIKDEPLQ